MISNPTALPQSNVFNNSYLSKYLNYEVSLRNGTKQIILYMKYLEKFFVLKQFWKREWKKIINSFFQGGSPLLALSIPEKIEMTGDEMNMYIWVLHCTDKSLSSSAGSTIPPLGLPASLLPMRKGGGGVQGGRSRASSTVAGALAFRTCPALLL